MIRPHPLLKIAAALGAAAMMTLLTGFFVFCSTLPRLSDADALTPAGAAQRGIIVLTGGGGPRIERGLALQAAGLGDRVLISGVNPRTTIADLARIGNAEVLECCVDLGPWARTTRDNALESRAWITRHGYDTVLLVTSDFHLPRARLELRRTMPDITILAVPVNSELAPETGWMAQPSSWALLASEYLKFLYVRVQSLF